MSQQHGHPLFVILAAAALVGAGMVSVLLFPLFALALRRRTERP